MDRIGRLTQLVGLNAIPVAGLMYVGWSDDTALALYWCETLMVLFLVALRIRIHRKLTNKRGHFVESVLTIKRGNYTKTERKIGYYSGTFLTVGLAFQLAPGVFVAAAVWQHVDVQALRKGLSFSLVFLLTGFLLDLTTIRERPFMWIRKMSDFTWWRIVLVNIAGLVGLFGKGQDFPRAGVITFVVLKVYTDVAANWPSDYDPREPPRFTKWFTKDTQETKLEWEAEWDDRHKIYSEDEEPFDGRPSRPVTYEMKSSKPKIGPRLPP